MISKPIFFSQNVESIKLEQLKKYKAVLIDVDNTLTKHHEKKLTKEKKHWIKNLTKSGKRIALASNTSKSRAKNLSIKFGMDVFVAYKPFPFAIKNWMIENGFKKDEVVMIGDQIFTDHLAAIFANIDSVLVKPITNRDFIVTRLISRRLEKIIYNLWSK